MPIMCRMVEYDGGNWSCGVFAHSVDIDVAVGYVGLGLSVKKVGEESEGVDTTADHEHPIRGCGRRDGEKEYKEECCVGEDDNPIEDRLVPYSCDGPLI